MRPKREFALLLDVLAYAHFARIFFKYVLSDGVRFNAKNGDTLGSGALTPIELDCPRGGKADNEIEKWEWGFFKS